MASLNYIYSWTELPYSFLYFQRNKYIWKCQSELLSRKNFLKWMKMKRLYIRRNFEFRTSKTEHYQLNLLNAMTRAGHRKWKKWVTQPAPTVNNQYRTTSKQTNITNSHNQNQHNTSTHCQPKFDSCKKHNKSNNKCCFKTLFSWIFFARGLTQVLT